MKMNLPAEAIQEAVMTVKKEKDRRINVVERTLHQS
jgi:hypothetical protein